MDKKMIAFYESISYCHFVITPTVMRWKETYHNEADDQTMIRHFGRCEWNRLAKQDLAGNCQNN